MSRSKDKLATYRKKRDFFVTPEPRGKKKRRVKGFGYLIQKHDASRLHYDFRLELDGVLLSWAVPKGPSLSPKERRLAVRTEDHPIEYGSFEGVIPEGEYGGGTVMLWDRGSWEPNEDPREGLEKGHLVFTLHGERLRGRWHLVRTRPRAREKNESWLLFKGKDAEATKGREPVDVELTSVASGRSMDAIASDADRSWSSKEGRAKKARPKRTPAARAKRAKATQADLSGLVAQIPTSVKLTNLDKVLFPDGLTKGALIAYYAIVEPYMLPHLENRPLTLVRCPNGAPRGSSRVHQTPSRRDAGEVAAAKHCFYQKHVKRGLDPAIIGVPIREDDGTIGEYMAVGDRDGLFAVAQLGSLELHTWGCHIDDVERPDTAVIDLDPDEALPWRSVVRAAFEVRAVLEDLGLKSWVKTTGGKGIHVCFPIVRRTSWDDFKDFTRGVATTIVASDPKRYTANMAKAQRTGKIFIDYLRNGRGATAVAPYSTRARRGAPVAAPITWDELEAGAHPRDFNLRSMMSRLETLKVDPWADFLKTKQSITQATWRKLAA
jgi:bifunctional non-homologous end joining protein LigD